VLPSLSRYYMARAAYMGRLIFCAPRSNNDSEITAAVHHLRMLTHWSDDIDIIKDDAGRNCFIIPIELVRTVARCECEDTTFIEIRGRPHLFG
jgi:hypothetical protein